MNVVTTIALDYMAKKFNDVNQCRKENFMRNIHNACVEASKDQRVKNYFNGGLKLSPGITRVGLIHDDVLKELQSTIDGKYQGKYPNVQSWNLSPSTSYVDIADVINDTILIGQRKA